MAAVLFDVDGTLVDSVDAHARAWVAALDAFGYAVTFERIRPMIGMGGDKILPLIDATLSSKDGTGKAISERRSQIFLEREVAGLRQTPGAAELLAAVRARGLRALLATSAQPDELEVVLEQTGLTGLVEPAASAKDAARSKPDPDVVHAALANGGIEAADAAFVGDTRYDIEAGRKAGVRTIGVRCGGMDPGTLSGADAVYDDPAAILTDFDGSPLASLAR